MAGGGGKRATARDRQREETRSRLFHAALDAIRKDGLEGARIDEIASEAGVSRATFYFHFPTRDDVLLQALAESEERVREQLDALPADMSATEVLGTAARAIAAEWQDEPELLREVGTVALRATAAALPQGTGDHAVRDALVPRFAHAIERGEVDGRIPAQLLAEFFLVGLFAAASAWTHHPLLPLDDLLQNVVRFFLRGARPDA